MTTQRSLKQRIRARMAETGEKYTVARREVLSTATRLRVYVGDEPFMDDWTFTGELRDDETKRAGK